MKPDSPIHQVTISDSEQIDLIKIHVFVYDVYLAKKSDVQAGEDSHEVDFDSLASNVETGERFILSQEQREEVEEEILNQYL